MDIENVQRYKIAFIAAVLVIGLFAVSPEPVSAPCVVDSNCADDEYCSFLACNPVECSITPDACSSDSGCADNTYCKFDASSTSQISGHACVGGGTYNICSFCFGDWQDCSSNGVGGCNTNTKTDANNCGLCGKVCPSGFVCTAPGDYGVNYAGTCSSGSCNPVTACQSSCCKANQFCSGNFCACSSGYADCDNDPSVNGCEINTNTDKNNCGSCGTVCAGTLSCVSGSCTCVGGANGAACSTGATGCSAGNSYTPDTCSASCSWVDGSTCVSGSCGASSQCGGTSPGSYLTICGSGITQTLDYCSSTCQYGDSTRCNTGTCGAPSQCNNLEAGISSCTTAGGIAGTCSGSCACIPSCVDNTDNDDFYTEGAECGPVDCDDGNANVYPGSCHPDAISWSSTCATSTTGGCGSGTCSRVTNGVICGTQDCDSLDTTCRNYDDVSIACSGGSCPGSAPCNSYTDSSSDTACGSSSLNCFAGSNKYCSGGNVWADTDFDPSCTRYCSGGSCEPSCDPGSCDTALWQACGTTTRICTAGSNRYCDVASGDIYADTDTDKTCSNGCSGGSCVACTPAPCDTTYLAADCSDTCTGEIAATYKAADTVVNYELCQPGMTSCPSTSLNDVCTGSTLTEYYCSLPPAGADPVAAPDVNCNSYDYECQGTCGTGPDSCVARDYSCSGGGNGYCSFSTVDADTGSGWCGGCGAQGIVWSTGGEAAAFGEYDTGTSTECCGDDSNEKYRSTVKGGSTYSACCNSATDCVDVSNNCVSDGTQSAGFKCVGGVWADGDVSEAQCTFAGGYWIPGGEVVATPCCGDDSGENPLYRKCAAGACSDVLADKKCCDAPTDCIFNGQCYSDVNKAMFLVELPQADCKSLKTQSACEKGAGKSKDDCLWNAALNRCIASRATVQANTVVYSNLSAYADVDFDGTDEVCVAGSPGEWQETAGTVTGTVRNVSTGDQCAAQCPAPCVQGCPVDGAVVKVLGTALSATTDAAGTYTVANVPSRTHDLTAAKSGYEAGTAYGIFVPDAATVTVDFTLVRALSGGCEDDCTTVGSNLCDATCHGKGLCWFDSDATKQACDGTFGLTEMPTGEYVDCCKGKLYTPIKAQATVPSKNVVVTKKPVLYKGKFVNMVIVVFER